MRCGQNKSRLIHCGQNKSWLIHCGLNKKWLTLCEQEDTVFLVNGVSGTTNFELQQQKVKFWGIKKKLFWVKVFCCLNLNLFMKVSGL